MKTDYDVAVIGSGPAGFTAAIYLKRANLNCVIIEKDAPGGQILKTSIIENYPGFENIEGPELAMKFYEQVQNMKIPYIFNTVTEIIDKKKYKIIKLGKDKIKVKAIILAVGRQPKTLKNSTLVKDGISYCSLCDGLLYRNQDVAIVGGGNSALEESLYLAYICKSVTIIHRRDEFRGDDILEDKIAKKKNIKVIYNSEIIKFNEVDGKLDSLDIKTEDVVNNLKVKACFIFIGYEPATEFLENLGIVDKQGYIEVNDKMETKIENIFAAGDVVKKEAYQIVTANSDGALAAISCSKKFN